MQRQAMAYYKLMAAIVIWAGVYPVAKFAVAFVDPYLMCALRYTVAIFFSLALLKLSFGYFIPSLNYKQWVILILIGLIGICGYNLLFFWAEHLISANTVAILYAFTPCITTVLSSIIFKTRLSLISMLGVIVALVGAIGVINYATPNCNSFFCINIIQHISLGEILAILAAFTFALYSILCKFAVKLNIPSLVTTTYSTVSGFVFLLLIACFKADFRVLPNLPFNFWLALAYISILATVISYVWYNDAIVKLGVFKTVVFQNTLPFITILIGFVFFHEKISFGELACGAVIITGVYITNISLMKKTI